MAGAVWDGGWRRPDGCTDEVGVGGVERDGGWWQSWHSFAVGVGGVERDGGWPQLQRVRFTSLGGWDVGVWRFWNCLRDTCSKGGLFTFIGGAYGFGLVLDIVVLDALRDVRAVGTGGFGIDELLVRGLPRVEARGPLAPWDYCWVPGRGIML